jgi:hypothetical protein
MAENDFAILIGVSKYAQLSSLKGPENDINDFEDWLLKQAQVPRNHIIRECSSQYPDPTNPRDARPGLDQLLAPFLDHAEIAYNNDDFRGRRLYVYLSGHGFSINSDAVAVFPANARRFGSYAGIDGVEYSKTMSLGEVFKEFVVFADCCRDYVPTKGAVCPFHVEPTEKPVEPRIVWGLAAPFNNKAVEQSIKLADGTEQVRGMFSYALCKALREATGNEQGEVTIDDIENLVLTIMPIEFGREFPEPRFGPREGRHPMVLVTRPKSPASPAAAPPVQVTLSVADVPDDTMVDISISPSPPFKSEPVKNGSAKVELKPGLYKASVRNTNRSHVFEAAGSTTDVSIA